MTGLRRRSQRVDLNANAAHIIGKTMHGMGRGPTRSSFFSFSLAFFHKRPGAAPKYLQGNNLERFSKEISHFYLKKPSQTT